MRRPLRAVLLALVVVTVLAAVVAGVHVASLYAEVAWEGPAESPDAVLAGWASLPEVPGVVLRVEGPGGAVYAGAAGTLERGGGEPVTPDTPFHVASVGKMFTAVTVLRLAERGAIDLDRPVAEVLGDALLAGLVVIDGVDRGARITPRHLLTHRAGLGNTDDDLGFQARLLLRPGRRWTPGELLDRARGLEPAGIPGERSAYASPGYFLLGLLIEKVAGRPYHDVVRAEVFEPLGMERTWESTHEWAGQDAVLHHHAGRFDLARHDPSFEFADGGFVSTAADLTRFGRALLAGEAFDRPETLDVLLSPWPGEEPVGFYQAHGPTVYRPEAGPTQVFHSGYWGVYLVLLPDDGRVAALTLAQSNASGWTFWEQVRPLLEP